jgi:hypothetical protein
VDRGAFRQPQRTNTAAAQGVHRVDIKDTVADYDSGLLAASVGSQNTTGFNLGLVTATTATVYYSGIVLADNWIGRAPDPEMILLGGKWTPAAISII